jgi:hypothetical protein
VTNNTTSRTLHARARGGDGGGRLPFVVVLLDMSYTSRPLDALRGGDNVTTGWMRVVEMVVVGLEVVCVPLNLKK